MRYFEIEHPLVFEITGQDAARYLNARLTQDIKKVGVNSSALGAALTPQGKTQAIFFVIRLEEQRFFVVSDSGVRTDILAALKKYIVADRVNVTDVSEAYSLFHILPDAEERALKGALGVGELPGRGNASLCAYGIACGRNRGFGLGVELLIQKVKQGELLSLFEGRKAHQFSRSDISYSRIVSRLPSFPEELNEQSLFSEARFHDALATNKGCYVGQEVVEKVESFAKTARVLQVIECQGCVPLTFGEQILTGEGVSIGKALSNAWNPQLNKTVCFAQVKNDKSLAGTSVKIGEVEGTLLWED